MLLIRGSDVRMMLCAALQSHLSPRIMSHIDNFHLNVYRKKIPIYVFASVFAIILLINIIINNITSIILIENIIDNIIDAPNNILQIVF